jgi:hypothetical protein
MKGEPYDRTDSEPTFYLLSLVLPNLLVLASYAFVRHALSTKSNAGLVGPLACMPSRHNNVTE